VVAANGQQIRNFAIQNSGNQSFEIDASNFPSGLYTVKVFYENGTFGWSKLSKL